MWTLMWLAIFGAVCSASMDLEDHSKMSSAELLNFNVGDFQGMVFASHFQKRFDNVSFAHAVANKSMDVMIGDCAMIYRIPRLHQSPAQNFSLLSYKLTRMMVVGGENCHGFDFNLNLVSLVKLSGHIEVCSGSGGFWSVAGKPCISVLGMDVGCTELNLSSDKVSSCWNLNIGLAKASVCGVVKNNCLNFNGEGCYSNFVSWSCKDFDATATCW